MPFKSKAQQRYLESKASPLTAAQKREWEGDTNFAALPERISSKTAKVSAKRRKKRG